MKFTIEICRSAIDFRPRVDWTSFAALMFEQMRLGIDLFDMIILWLNAVDDFKRSYTIYVNSFYVGTYQIVGYTQIKTEIILLIFGLLRLNEVFPMLVRSYKMKCDLFWHCNNLQLQSCSIKRGWTK